jgi:replicative DNA helicase
VTVSEQAMPSNLEAERMLVSALILESRVFDRVSPIVTASDFRGESYRRVYEAVSALEGQGLELFTLTERMRTDGTLGGVGGVAGLMAILDGPIPDIAGAERYAKTIHEAAVRRGIIVECQRMQNAAFSPEHPIADLASKGALLFADFARIRDVGPVPIKTISMRSGERLEARMLSDNWLTGIATGIAPLDAYTLGIQRRVLSVIGARPRIGKTAFGINISLSAMAAGLRVLFVELDMSESMFGDRLMSAVSGVSSFKIRSGKGLGSDEMQAIAIAQKEQHQLGDRLIVDFETRDIALIAATIRREARHGLDLVIVDHIGHVRGGKGEKRYLEIGDVSSRLIELAGESGAAVLALVQLGRSAEDREPELSDLRESGNLEQDARLVILLDRPRFRDSSTADCLIKMKVPKNEGEAGHTFDAHFDLRIQRITVSPDQRCQYCSFVPENERRVLHEELYA